jgi:DNA-binding HxlR family transcriptional regulator
MEKQIDIKHTEESCNGSLSAIGDAIYVIGGKWKLRIIIALSDGNKRFNELQRTIPGISARVLSNELKELELNGFVKRKVYIQTPVLVEYEITEYSHTLNDVTRALEAWGKMHREKIVKEIKLQSANDN